MILLAQSLFEIESNFFNSHGEVLLQKRAQIKESFPGYWDTSSSGHM